MIPEVGDPAPDRTVRDLTGRRVNLSTTWQNGPVILAFVRYFGCPFCQAFVGRLHDAESAFQERGVDVALVGQGSTSSAIAFTGPRRLRFTLYLDTERSAYRAFGLTAGGAGQLVGPSVAASWVQTHARREGLQKGLQGGSFRQMPGTFIVDQIGILRFVHRNSNVAADPSIEVLLRALDDLEPRSGEPKPRR